MWDSKRSRLYTSFFSGSWKVFLGWHIETVWQIHEQELLLGMPSLKIGQLSISNHKVSKKHRLLLLLLLLLFYNLSSTPTKAANLLSSHPWNILVCFVVHIFCVCVRGSCRYFSKTLGGCFFFFLLKLKDKKINAKKNLLLQEHNHVLI